ncbi:BBP7 family outer membrane beta-barrel protein [Aeoliella sp. ICT_H6.2]|uniref:BBP7 family outer membrane beta-barrel protein n=1 Tax=Aeoliella straminimaris TaxID=2954799 RepID=A0A9X2F7R0_9BACT|nr:BBP7 family outer membrane beta-barrel protein [Aeoliella straminimaris]MCO6043880.1 BBP7 family outer membrane beta-barrel protein [Aeoliella straminimaris]
MDKVCSRTLRVSLARTMMATVALLATGFVTAQPLAWSPQRGGAQPVRSLADLAADPAPSANTPPQTQMQQALLIRNPDTSNGTSEYALADQFGRVQRYVESSPGIDLASFVGERVTVRSDTGTTLLASQLNLPITAAAQQYAAPQFDVVQAEHQQPVAQRINNNSQPQHRTAQVAPVVVDQYGMTSNAAPGNCPNCTVNQYGMPAGGGYINGYDAWGSGNACNECQTYSPYFVSPDTSFNPSCCRGARGRFYGRAEYLLWWIDGMNIPPLVTSSPAGTPQGEAGVLGEEGTSILFGGGEVLGGSRDGLRFQLGTWFNEYRDLAIEGDIFFFETASTGFSATGDGGSPILARPFFNMVPVDGVGDVLPPAEDAELVSYPNVVEGTVSVDTRSDFGGAGLRLRAAICCKEIGGVCNTCSPCGPAVGPSSVSRIDVIAGYRFFKLDERVLIQEDLNSLLTASPGTFDIYDRFDTYNEFHGGDVGFIWEWESTRWTLEFLSKVALGNTHQRVTVDGGTTVSDGVNSYSEEGGLLALRSNIGKYDRDKFTAIPEIGLTAGYRITPRLKATVGYTLIYWGSVARPGEHIDLDVNPNLLPPVVEPVVGPERPRFRWDDTSLLAHGLNLGLDYRF